MMMMMTMMIVTMMKRKFKKISVTVLHSYLDFGASRSIVIVRTRAFVDGVFDVTHAGAVAENIYTIPYYATSRCHTIPYHTIPYHTIPYHTIPYHTIPYHTKLNHTKLNHTTCHILNRTKPHYTIPCIISHHIIQYLSAAKYCKTFLKLARVGTNHWIGKFH